MPAHHPSRSPIVGYPADELPLKQAQVSRLAFFSELSFPGIALDLGLPLGTVKSRIRLAPTHQRLALEGLV